MLLLRFAIGRGKDDRVSRLEWLPAGVAEIFCHTIQYTLASYEEDELCTGCRWYHARMDGRFFADRRFLRNLVFGIEDGVVSTVGLLSGIAIAGVDPWTIFLTGVVLIFVEAFSMAAGSYLSEESVEERFEVGVSERRSIEGGVVMFFSYAIAGFIPLLPYILVPIEQAFTMSIVASFIALFVLGLWSGRGRRMWRAGVRMMLIGGAAIIVGVTVGSLVG